MKEVTQSVVLNMLVLFLLDNVLHVLLSQDNPRRWCLLNQNKCCPIIICHWS